MSRILSDVLKKRLPKSRMKYGMGSLLREKCSKSGWCFLKGEKDDIIALGGLLVDL